ncbi:PadR family transcriptional regulator [Plantactinospora sp. KLBMP9567]|uniref:PadR family transcriptional regulator n=1 Tax=Plantactinospora sp. KLBMP9567 TaxID=3085900 RepID=UPI002980BC24|nr:PadR family transcriptional regulator [Plantactinospora sp. KLBMP9567]MDW5328583.1 PadR family transcriptional regulator [Plantactinospora sp. KLBMP9567]
MIVAEHVSATDRRSQLLRGVLDMCMLALLAGAPTHGYELVRRLNAAGLEAVGYGTVYPLLARMGRLGLVAVELQDSPSGPARKVYRLTPQGRQALHGWAGQWAGLVDMINATLAGLAPSTSSTEE